MATAEELLNSLETIEDHIVIGSDRRIIIPNSLKTIAVQFDHNIETVTFDCPRYWDGIDMSKMAIYVNYRRADGYLDSVVMDNVRVDENDESIMHFDWTISRNVTMVKGAISFLVCVKNTDNEGNEVNHWNSELNREMTVSEGLECAEQVIDDYPDIITDLLLRVSQLDNTVRSGVYKMPSTKIHLIKDNKLYITQNVEEGHINKKSIRFGDFLYWSDYNNNTYSVYQVKIEKMYDINGIAFTDFYSGYTYNDIDSIDISNSEPIYVVNYETNYDFPYEKNSFWFSNNYAMSKTDTFMYLDDLPFELKEEQGSNTPISENVSISGEDNVVGCRGFKILSCEQIGTTTGKYFLNSVEGLCVGDIYSAIFDSYYIDLGKITSIDTNEKSVVVTNFKNEMNDNPNDNILFIVSKPFLGTEDIGQLASASGVNNFALLMGASAEGKLTKAIGRFSKTRGLRTIAKGYGSSADGAGLVATRNYQRVAGFYNIEDTEEKYLDIVGNGKNDNKRSNAYTLDEYGNGWYAGNLDVTQGVNAKQLTVKNGISANNISINDIVVKNGINGKAKFDYNYTPTKEITFEGKYRKVEENNIEFPIMNGYINFWDYGNLFIKELQNIVLRATENYYDTIKIKEGKIYREKRILELDLTGLEWGLSTTNIYISKLNNILGNKWSEYGKKCLKEGSAIASFGEYIGRWTGNSGMFSNNNELSIQQSSSGIYVRMYYADENVKDANTFNQYIRNLEASGNPMKLYVVLNDDLIETTEWITEYSEFIQTYFKNENTNTYLCTTNYGDISGIIQKENDIDIIEELATLRADINKRIKYIDNKFAELQAMILGN